MKMKFDPSQHKCAILVDDALALGYAANAVSVIGMSLGHLIDGLVGPDIHSQDNICYRGVIYSPLPILLAKGDAITALHNRLFADPDLTLMPFSALAQSCKTYSEYEDKMAMTPSEHIRLVALGIVGTKKKVNKFTGNLSLFR